MLIYPAIDLINGECVRLVQGRFNEVSRYDTDPASRLANFVSEGAELVHIVDLDGVRAGKPQQYDLITELTNIPGAKVQAAGGIREASHVELLLVAGVQRVVIGSLAIANKPLIADWLRHFGPEQVTLSLDITILEEKPIVTTHGWTESSGETLWNVLSWYADAGLKHVLVTDVSRDGMLGGPNVALMEDISRKFPELSLQASGGVGELEDIRQLGRTEASAVIVGKALYENRFTLKEAINAGA